MIGSCDIEISENYQTRRYSAELTIHGRVFRLASKDLWGLVWSLENLQSDLGAVRSRISGKHIRARNLERAKRLYEERVYLRFNGG